MLGMGNRRRPWGSNNRPERALVRETAATSASFTARHSRRRSLLLSVAAALVIGGTTVFVVAAGAGPLNTLGSGYDINGVVPDASIPASAFFDDPHGSVAELDVINQATAKLGNIRYDAPATLDYNDENPGNDLSGVWMDTNVVAGQVWLYLGFSRDAASTGQVVFEFNKNAAPTACDYSDIVLENPPGADAKTQTLIDTCNPWANRSPGDFSLAFDVQGGAAKIVKRVYFDTGSGNNQQGWTETTLDAAVSEAMFGADKLTGEAVINLSATVFPTKPTSCFSVANILPYTITGNSDSADMKDVILEDFTDTISISNCGSINVVKNTGGLNGTFGFTTTSVPTTTYNPFDITTTGGTGSHQQGSLLAGTYTVTESGPPANWSFTSLTCNEGSGSTIDLTARKATISLDANENVTCTYTNARDTGSLKISKVFDPLTSGFTGTFAINYDCSDGTAHDGTANVLAGGNAVIGGIPTGTTCVVSEPAPTNPTGWSFGTPTLSDSQAPSTDGTVVITTKAATYEVIVTNSISRDTGSIQIVKDFTGLDTGNKPVDLKLGDVVKKAALTADDETTVMTVGSGPYVVSEVFTGQGDGKLYDSSYSCSNHDDGTIQGTVGEGLSVEVSVGEGDAIVCTFVNDRKDSSITVDKQVKVTGTDDAFADTAAIDEPGVGKAVNVTYRLVITNPAQNSDTIHLTAESFADMVNVNGDAALGSATTLDNLDCAIDQEGDGLPTDLAPDDSVTCTFTKDIAGEGGDQVNDLATVTGTDESGREISASDPAQVTITDIESDITVTKVANPTAVKDSGPVTFTVVVRNNSTVDTVFINELNDSIYGDLNGQGDCAIPQGGIVIAPSASYTCSFTKTVSKTETDIVTASGVDDDGHEVIDDDPATVTVTTTPPPPYIPSTDISVTKAATPQVQLPQGGGTAAITYNLIVVNNGPDAAANVKVADTAPASVSFVSATTSAGTCTTTAQALDCTIVSLAPGASVAITIKATVNATGTKVNVVLVTTSTPETNAKNNQASAQTIVNAPLTPPKPPVVKADICRTLVANPKMLKANGKAQRISIKVTQGTKGVAGISVKITGPGISKTVLSGKGGKVKVTVKPSQPGIIRLAIQGKKACNTQRIGVVGIFEPPVTG